MNPEWTDDQKIDVWLDRLYDWYRDADDAPNILKLLALVTMYRAISNDLPNAEALRIIRGEESALKKWERVHE